MAKYAFLVFIYYRHSKDMANFVSPRNFTLLCKIRREAYADLGFQPRLDELVASLISEGYSKPGDLIQLHKVNPIYDIKDLLQVTSELMRVERKLKLIEKGIDLGKYTRAQKQGELNSLDEDKKSLRQTQNEILAQASKPGGLRFTGWVFISFKTVDDLLKVKARRNLSLSHMKLGLGSPWRSVPEPADVIWENWAASRTRKTLIRLGNFLLVFLIIAVNFGVILGFKFLQARIADWLGSDRNTSSLVASIVVSVVISIIIGTVNFLIRLVLIWLTQFESYKTHSTLFAEVVFKVVLLQFVNKALIVLLTNKIIQPAQDWQVFGSSAVVGNMVVTMIISVFFDVLVYLVEPRYLVKVFRRWRIRRAKSAITDQVFQVEANEAFEGIKFDVAEAYFLSFSTLCVAFFYQAIIPYGLLMGLVEVALKYVIVKYVLVKRSVKPQDLEFEFTRKMFHQFEFCVFLLSLGYVVFYVLFRTDGVPLNVFFAIALGIAGADWLIISRLINLWVVVDHDPDVKHTFDSQELLFPMDYDRQNPATQRNAFIQFLRKVRCRADFVPAQPATPATENAEDLIENIENYALHGEHGPGGVTFDAGTSAFNVHVRQQRNPHGPTTPEPYNFQAMMNEPHMRSFIGYARGNSTRQLIEGRPSEETVEFQTPAQRNFIAGQFEIETLRHSVLYGRSTRVLTDSIANFNYRGSANDHLINMHIQEEDQPETPPPRNILKDDDLRDSPTLDVPHLETNPHLRSVELTAPRRLVSTNPNIQPSQRSVNTTSHPQFGRLQTSVLIPNNPLNDQTGAPPDASPDPERRRSSMARDSRPRMVSWATDLTPVQPPRNPDTPDTTPVAADLIRAMSRPNEDRDQPGRPQ